MLCYNRIIKKKTNQKENKYMKKYDVYFAGGTKIKTIEATCISKACKEIIAELSKKATYELCGRSYASIRYKDNYSVGSDFVVMES